MPSLNKKKKLKLDPKQYLSKIHFIFLICAALPQQD